MDLNFKEIEQKWQNKWEEASLFEVKKNNKKKYYVLEMFPYPSGDGLHMGHALNYTIGDVFARFKIMNGFNVLHPMGYDALGLPAENAAIQKGQAPQDYTDKSIAHFMKQQKSLGITYDWSRVVNTADSSYYKWDQWIFLKMFEKGLAYQKESAVNWCPKCDTVLANEQVQNGCCWRHDETEVEVKHLKQWFFKITDYADELYEEIDGLDWPEKTKAMQKNWIGKSHGTEISFEINEEKWPIFTTRPDTIFGVTFMVVSAQHKKLQSLVTKEQKAEVEKFLKKIKSVSEKEMEDMEKEGVFTGSYAINPVNNEKVPVYVGNFVVADYGAGMVMAVPAHDQRDFEFAKKYGIEIKEVISPVYGNPKKDAEKRNTISAIVHRKKDNKYLAVKFKKFGWIAPVVGGIDGDETPEKAAEREVFEETGYKTKAVKKLGGVVIEHFFAENKNVYRHRIDQPILLELIDDKIVELDEEEKEKHESLWLSADEFFKKVSHRYNLIGLERYLGKDLAYTGEGVLTGSKQFNGLNNKEAIKKITEYLIKEKKGKRVVNFKLRDWGISRQRYWGTPIPIAYCEKCGAVPVKEKDLPVALPKKVKFGKGNPLATNEEWIQTKCPKCGGKARRETDTMDTFVNSSWYFLRYSDSKNDKKIFDSDKANYWCPIDMYIGGAEHACMHLIYFRFYTKFLADLKLINFREPAKKLFHQGMLAGEGGIKMSKSKGNVVTPEHVSETYGIDTARVFLLSLASPEKGRDWNEKGIQGSQRLMQRIYDYFSKLEFGKDSELTLSRLNKTIKEVTNEIQDFKYNLSVIKLRQLFEHFENEKISKDTAQKFLKLLAPFAPHIAEELWAINNDGFVSVAEWPKANEKLINEQLERREELIDSLRQDVLKIKELAKIEKVSKVKIFIAPKWKWKALEIIKENTKERFDFGLAMKALMQKEEMKKYGQEIQVFLKAINSKQELLSLEEFDEVSVLKNVKDNLEKEFGEIEIINAEDSKEAKAKNALPGKPALIVE